MKRHLSSESFKYSYISRLYKVVHLLYKFSLLRKYPSASKKLRWQYLFSSKKISKDPRSNTLRRHHVMESGLQKAIKRAVMQAGYVKTEVPRLSVTNNR